LLKFGALTGQTLRRVGKTPFIAKDASLDLMSVGGVKLEWVSAPALKEEDKKGGTPAPAPAAAVDQLVRWR
jgi:hypothetical protein